MGNIYLAHANDDRQNLVIVKEAKSEEFKEDLMREIETLKALGPHPNIVTLLDYHPKSLTSEQSPNPFIVLNYSKSHCLYTYLQTTHRHAYSEPWTRYFFK